MQKKKKREKNSQFISRIRAKRNEFNQFHHDYFLHFTRRVGKHVNQGTRVCLEENKAKQQHQKEIKTTTDLNSI